MLQAKEDTIHSLQITIEELRDNIRSKTESEHTHMLNKILQHNESLSTTMDQLFHLGQQSHTNTLNLMGSSNDLKEQNGLLMEKDRMILNCLQNSSNINNNNNNNINHYNNTINNDNNNNSSSSVNGGSQGAGHFKSKLVNY